MIVNRTSLDNTVFYTVLYTPGLYAVVLCGAVFYGIVLLFSAVLCSMVLFSVFSAVLCSMVMFSVLQTSITLCSGLQRLVLGVLRP